MYLLRWTIFIWIILLALVLAAISYGHTKPDRLSSFALDVCEDNPCFSGIIPGVTQWNDVPSHLENYDVWLQEIDRIGMMFNNTIGADIYRDPSTETVATRITVFDATITELTPTNFPSVGDLILKYGEPCWVILDNHVQSVVLPFSQLVYPTMTLNFGHIQPFVPSATIGDVRIFRDDLCSNERFTPTAALSEKSSFYE
jgi:hypothetical protein